MKSLIPHQSWTASSNEMRRGWFDEGDRLHIPNEHMSKRDLAVVFTFANHVHLYIDMIF